jgi:hypothetical protein
MYAVLISANSYETVSVGEAKIVFVQREVLDVAVD